MPEQATTPQANDNWRDSLPEDIKFAESITKFKDIPSLARSYMGLEKTLGSRIAVPGDDAKPEDWETFFKHVGRPDKSDGYEFPTEDKLPKGIHIDKEFGDAFRDISHKMGLSKKQFAQLVDWGVNQSQGMLALQQQEAEQNQAALKKEWGYAHDGNLEKAHRTLTTLVGGNANDPFLQYLEQSGMGNHPEFLKFMFRLGDRFKEDAFIDSKGNTEAIQKEDAQKQIRAIRADPKHPYHDEKNPAHFDALKEMKRLYEIANPGA